MPRRKPQKWQRHRNSHLATEFPKKGRCGECGAPVLIGPVSGLTTKFDPYLLTLRSEAEALLLGLRTFHAWHPQFTQRRAGTITRDPNPRLGYVVREHRCGAALPIEIAAPRVYEIPADAPPPF